MKKQYLEQQVRTILLSQWDPIGIKNNPGAQDEYDSYVLKIAQFVQEQKEVAFLANHLLRIEIHSMGLPGDHRRATTVARQLSVLPMQHRQSTPPKINLYTRVKLLNNNYTDDGITEGMTGYVIEIYDENAYEVEFSHSNGETIAQVVLTNQDIEKAE